MDSVIQLTKSPNLDNTRNLEDALVLNQNSVTKSKENLENQSAEEDVDIKQENTKFAKETCCTIKSPSMKTWTPVKNLGNVIQDVQSPNLDYTRNMEDTSVLYQNTKTVSKKENQMAEENGDIQHTPESTKCTKETSCTTKSPSMKNWTSVKDLDNVIQHVKTVNLDYTRNFEYTLGLNKSAVTKKENQIAEEERDIQHKLESTECSKETTCTIKDPSTKTWTLVKNLDIVIQHVKLLINLDCTRNLDDTSVLNQNSETVTKENLENQIAEGKRAIQHKPEITKCTKEISCTVKSTSILPQTPHRDLGTKENLTVGVKIFQPNIPAHCLWISLMQFNGSYDVLLSTATKFIRKGINVEVNTYVSFLMKIPLNKQEFNRVNHISNLYLEKTLLIFYKTVAPKKHNAKAPVSFNKHVPNIPMRPYPWKVCHPVYARNLPGKVQLYDIKEGVRDSEE